MTFKKELAALLRKYEATIEAYSEGTSDFASYVDTYIYIESGVQGESIPSFEDSITAEDLEE